MEQRNPNSPAEQERPSRGEAATEGVRHAGEQAKDAVHQATQKIDELRTKSPAQIAEEAQAQASRIVEGVRGRGSEAGTMAAARANDAMTATGEQMQTLAQTVRTRAPQDPRMHDMAMKAASSLEQGGQYLKDADVRMVRSDLERVIREHPVEALLVGIGTGYLIARSARR